MPSLGVTEVQTFLTHAQGYKFAIQTPTALTVVDAAGLSWPVTAGKADPEERSFGLFNGAELIARLTIEAPDPTGDCPTPFWSIGRIEVANTYHGLGLGRGLVEQVFQMLNAPLASDLNQTPEGAAMWRHLIALHPGKIELQDSLGGTIQVASLSGVCLPNPWSFPHSRLVRHP